MTYAALTKEIKAGKIRPVYLLHGQEHYFINQIAELLEKSVIPESVQAFNQTIVYGKDVDGNQLLGQLKRYPVMAERQLVVLREAQSFSGWDHLGNYFAQPAPTTVFVMSFKSQNNKKVDKRKKWYKNLNTIKDVAIFESKPVYDNKVPDWIISYLADHKFTMHPATAQTIGAYVGADLNTLANELNKLILLKDPGEEITMDDVEKNIGISKTYNVFELQKALGMRDVERSQSIALNLADHLKDQPIFLLLASLMGYFQKVYSCHSYKSKSGPELAKALGVHPFFVKDYTLAARNYTPASIDAIFHKMHETDKGIKGIDGARKSDRALLLELVSHVLYAK